MMTDTLHVVHARAAGLDVHKMQITASVRLCAPGAGEPRVETRTFEALASGLDAMVAWMRERSVDAAVMEGTGIYRRRSKPWRAPAFPPRWSTPVRSNSSRGAGELIDERYAAPRTDGTR